MPMTAPTFACCQRILKVRPLAGMRPVASPRTVIVDVWEPMLPPIPMITGTKVSRNSASFIDT